MNVLVILCEQFVVSSFLYYKFSFPTTNWATKLRDHCCPQLLQPEVWHLAANYKAVEHPFVRVCARARASFFV